MMRIGFGTLWNNPSKKYSIGLPARIRGRHTVIEQHVQTGCFSIGLCHRLSHLRSWLKIYG